MINQIIFDADVFTRFPGISTRSLWTIEELLQEYKKEKQIVWDNKTHKGWGEPDVTRDAYDYLLN
jgi:hypothetical protein